MDEEEEEEEEEESPSKTRPVGKVIFTYNYLYHLLNIYHTFSNILDRTPLQVASQSQLESPSKTRPGGTVIFTYYQTYRIVSFCFTSCFLVQGSTQDLILFSCYLF